jgi:hypothetical protein
MGLIRGLARWIVKTLLVMSIAAFLIASTGSHFSTKENITPLFQEIALSQFSESQTEELYNGLSRQCMRQENEIIKIPSPVGGSGQIEVNCTRLEEGKTAEVRRILKDEVVGGMIDSLSSAQCSGIDCINQGPAGLISEAFNKFLKMIQTLALIAIIVFGALVFILSEGISSKLIDLGLPFLFAGLPYFFANTIKNSINIPANFSGISDSVFSFLSSRFLVMFVIGAVLIAAGFIVKLTIEKKIEKKGGKKR